MASIPDHAAIYKKLHDTREEHVEQARRARDMQAELHRKSWQIERLLRIHDDLIYRLKIGDK